MTWRSSAWGATGSAAAHELARRGVEVIGFDRFTPPHAFGSSHGDSRIIREAYFEDPIYVPMVQRAIELWRELEDLSATPLLAQTGGLMIGAPDSVLVEGARRSARLHGLRHAMLSAGEIRARFPALHPDAGMVASGSRMPACCVRRTASRRSSGQARRHGAILRFDERCAGGRCHAARVGIVTALGHYVPGS